MNPEEKESLAWAGLHAHGASQLRHGFAERVLRKARDRALSRPSLPSQLLLGAATAAICFLAVVAADLRASHRAAATASVNDWQQIASASEDFAQAQ